MHLNVSWFSFVSLVLLLERVVFRLLSLVLCRCLCSIRRSGSIVGFLVGKHPDDVHYGGKARQAIQYPIDVHYVSLSRLREISTLNIAWSLNDQLIWRCTKILLPFPRELEHP